MSSLLRRTRGHPSNLTAKSWCCHSQGTGGGALELMRAVFRHRAGQELNSYATLPATEAPNQAIRYLSAEQR